MGSEVISDQQATKKTPELLTRDVVPRPLTAKRLQVERVNMVAPI